MNILDRLGIIGSTVCAVHCATFPILVAVLPLFGYTALKIPDTYHDTFIVATMLIGLASITMSLYKHGKFMATTLMVSGLALLSLTLLAHNQLTDGVHAILLSLGAIMVALAHYTNAKLLHKHVHGPNCNHNH